MVVRKKGWSFPKVIMVVGLLRVGLVESLRVDVAAQLERLDVPLEVGRHLRLGDPPPGLVVLVVPGLAMKQASFIHHSQ